MISFLDYTTNQKMLIENADDDFLNLFKKTQEYATITKLAEKYNFKFNKLRPVPLLYINNNFLNTGKQALEIQIDVKHNFSNTSVVIYNNSKGKIIAQVVSPTILELDLSSATAEKYLQSLEDCSQFIKAILKLVEDEKISKDAFHRF